MTEAAVTIDVPMDGLIRAHPVDSSLREAFFGAPCDQNHAPNLMPLDNGDLVCAWFAGTQEGTPDVSIYFSRLRAGVEQWSNPVKLSDDPTRSEQNPILFPAPDGRLWLIYTSQDGSQDGPNQHTSVVRYRISENGGETWSPGATLFDEVGTWVRQPVVVLEGGEWLLPTYRCQVEAGKRFRGDNDVSAVRISSDAGRTWRCHHIPDSRGAVHMNVVKSTSGGLLGFFRSRWADNIYVSRSDSSGTCWSVPSPTVLPNNNSSIQVRRLASRRLAVVFNDIRAADSQVGTDRRAVWTVGRPSITIALSDDEGGTWSTWKVLDSAASPPSHTSGRPRRRERSYPSLVEAPAGTLHIAYTFDRRAIRYVRIPEY